MTQTQLNHDRLMTKLRAAVGEVVDIDAGGDQAIEIAATALVDMTGIILARLPAAAEPDGAAVIGLAMSNRLARRMALEAHLRGQMMGLPGATSIAPGEPTPADKITKRPDRTTRGSKPN
ncbi:hypothetical protein BV98_002214 [Sphingobium herbicidovorans NBRC 16415]|uniref:Uncharacterized protein n=1 Tax=Sphingobium herbicidovorans (strain ATCC 700291 / DSM 11019 / CCUG 56400 / KCTC 2939 / LMG 18315 / NBRC 16415 / MH) TaxID=1219045 RepID=A0A086P9H3_SPHHM|nr:hypothetical protein [Sphingobium herbicidovorans]KFG90041.1 hypothetical protein BV98_002214 [Sphingobium herbicidovorans NBRC 16415]